MCSSIEVSPSAYINKIKWILKTRKLCVKMVQEDRMNDLRQKNAKYFFWFGRPLTDAELRERYMDRWSDPYYEIVWYGTYELIKILSMLIKHEFGKTVILSKDDVNEINCEFTRWSKWNADLNCSEAYGG